MAVGVEADADDRDVVDGVAGRPGDEREAAAGLDVRPGRRRRRRRCTIGWLAPAPLAFQKPKVSWKVSPRFSSIWSPAPLRTSDLALAIVRRGLLCDRPSLKSLPVELLT